MVDAGSCGSDAGRTSALGVAPAATRVLNWLNVSRHGLVHGTRELVGGAADIDIEATDADPARGQPGGRARASRSA